MQKRYALLCALFGVFSAGCYPGEIDTAAQTDLVATFHMEGADFTANHTYDMPDSVVDIGLASGVADTNTINHAHDAEVLAKVAAELAQLGYTRVDATTRKPDVVVLVSAIRVNNYDVWYSYPWYPYWGWWGGWDGWSTYSASSSYYYPWYPVTVTGYTTGSLFISMIDPDVVPPDPTQATPIWLAAINGLLEGTQIGTRVDNNITKAFAQSPYLHTQ
jgi:hypothetical protein